MNLKAEFYKIYSSGRVSAKFQKFVNGYCFIFPYFYPYDRHLCMISTIERSDSTHTFDITRWSVSSKALKSTAIKWRRLSVIIYFRLLQSATVFEKVFEFHQKMWKSRAFKARYSIANSFHPRWDIIGSIIKKKGDIKYAFFPIPEHNYLGFDDIPANLSELSRVGWTRSRTLVSADKHDDKWHF